MVSKSYPYQVSQSITVAFDTPSGIAAFVPGSGGDLAHGLPILISSLDTYNSHDRFVKRITVQSYAQRSLQNVFIFRPDTVPLRYDSAIYTVNAYANALLSHNLVGNADGFGVGNNVNDNSYTAVFAVYEPTEPILLKANDKLGLVGFYYTDNSAGNGQPGWNVTVDFTYDLDTTDDGYGVLNR